MNQTPSIDHLADDIRQIYRDDPERAAAVIETYLAHRLTDLPEDARKSFYYALTGRFAPSPPDTPAPETDMEEEVLTRIFSLLLGREISADNLSPRELMERLSESLSTIFATLNRLIQNINATLLGGAPGDQTIRHVIGQQMQGGEAHETLEAYLGRIDKAFFVAHQAFRQAAHTTVLKILRELDPEKIASEAGQGLKFGPLKKAEYFDIYEAKFSTLKKWFESGRFMEDLLREFENNCRMNH
ncbi:MAG: hypothetical protein RBT11_16860 [Desulfobacterales bacterium]|jgi:hypothetical protein|nr:hypothetical protein [Desulfobacterales bacterium]